ncbi:MAG: hypothetical protein ACRES2_05635 [Steroidobacteraceae bacterium]
MNLYLCRLGLQAAPALREPQGTPTDGRADVIELAERERWLALWSMCE